jgi:hypothetical protein
MYYEYMTTQYFVRLTIQLRLFIPTGPFSLVYVFRPAHLAGRNKLAATPIFPNLQKEKNIDE